MMLLRPAGKRSITSPLTLIARQIYNEWNYSNGFYLYPLPTDCYRARHSVSSLQLDVDSCPTLSYRYRENKVGEFKAQHPYNKNSELIEWSLYTIICGREQLPCQLKEDTRVGTLRMSIGLSPFSFIPGLWGFLLVFWGSLIETLGFGSWGC